MPTWGALFLTSDEHVEGVAVSRIVETWHGVEWPHRQGVPVKYIKLRVVPAARDRAGETVSLLLYLAFWGRIQVKT